MTEALYRQVYQALAEKIQAGTWAVGERLPSQDQLTAEFSVSAITVTRALDMLREDGYVSRRPRIGTVVVAQHPQRQSAGLPKVGYVVPGFDDAFGRHLLGGILHAAQERAHVVVALSAGEAEREQRMIAQHLDLAIDALILLPTSSQWIPPAVMALVAKSYPIVIVDRTLTGIPVSTVTSDNTAGGRLAVEHLVGLGHRDLALLMSPNDISTLADRRQGFVAAHAEQGAVVEADRIYTGVRSVVPGSQVSAEEDIAGLRELLQSQPEVTGYVTSEYHSALLLLRAAREMGLAVPQDLSVVCFDSPGQEPGMDLSLTHVRQDQWQIGQRALDLALAQIVDSSAIAQDIIDVELVAGGTSGPVPVTMRS